jgi:hypothetical protein
VAHQASCLTGMQLSQILQSKNTPFGTRAMTLTIISLEITKYFKETSQLHKHLRLSTFQMWPQTLNTPSMLLPQTVIVTVHNHKYSITSSNLLLCHQFLVHQQIANLTVSH